MLSSTEKNDFSILCPTWRTFYLCSLAYECVSANMRVYRKDDVYSSADASALSGGIPEVLGL